MPQIAQIDATFASQLFWLIITFGLIFLGVGLGMVPKISSTVEARDQRISGDLEAAERARAAADETEEAYRLKTEANRAEALKVTQAAKEASARDAETRIKAADAELNAKIGAAEVQIRTETDAALGEIEVVAVDAAEDLVARLSGAEVSRERAAQAVRAALGETVTVNG